MQKKIVPVFLVVCMLLLGGCRNRSMNAIIEREPSITGYVKDIDTGGIIIENQQEEYWVSLDAENGDSFTGFHIGDEVVVYYDGRTAEGDPMQIHKVYAITLKTPADRAVNECP